MTDALQREVIRESLKRASLTGPDQNLPGAVKVRHGCNAQGKLLHYYLNFSGQEQSVSYPYGDGSELFNGATVRQGQSLTLRLWDLAIVAEQSGNVGQI